MIGGSMWRIMKDADEISESQMLAEWGVLGRMCNHLTVTHSSFGLTAAMLAHVFSNATVKVMKTGSGNDEVAMTQCARQHRLQRNYVRGQYFSRADHKLC